MTPPAPEGDDAIFSRRTAAWLAGISAVSLAATLIGLAFSGRMRAGDSPQADAFSRSSIGYRALVELLDASGVRVVVSRFRSSDKVGPEAPLLIAEPDPAGLPPLDPDGVEEDEDDEPSLTGLVAAAEAHGAPVVVVLPRHLGAPSADRDGWIGALDDRGRDDAGAVLERLAGSSCHLAPLAPLAPGEAPPPWSSALPGGDLPTLPAPQLVAPDCGLTPLVWSDAGVLIGRLPESGVHVVADPDLLNTHGLAHGQNAVIAHRLFVDHLRASSLVVDEVLHGFYQPPSIWTELLTLPLLPVTLHVVGLTLLAIAAASARLGAPRPAPPRVPPGKRALVDSTAALLDGGGHHTESVRHYLRMTLRHTAAALGLAPAAADPLASLPALAAIARARAVQRDITRIARDVGALPARGRRAAAEARALAAAIDGWRKEMLDGHR